jgi:BirA family biotin operon repressor/biotin-[acetyl-CoA-carboxylase] ligase
LYKIPANTLFLGKNLVFVPECHSTNDLALQLTRQSSVIDGSLIITNNQTAGRGQRGNTWNAEAGMNLTFSLIFKPGFLAVKDQFYLNIFTSLALRDYLKGKTELNISIKWPNDILVHSQKICGILIENQIQGTQLSNSIVGIGLNINQINFSISTATSVGLITGKQLSLENELHELLSFLEARYLQLRENKFSFLREEYLSVLYWRNEKHTFSSSHEEFDGRIVDIDEHGKLIIETEQGNKSFDLKEVQYIK